MYNTNQIKETIRSSNNEIKAKQSKTTQHNTNKRQNKETREKRTKSNKHHKLGRNEVAIMNEARTTNSR